MQNNNPKVSNILTLACKVTGKRITLPEKDLMQAGTILIVDDNKSVLTSLELLLEDEFEGVETASNPNSILVMKGFSGSVAYGRSHRNFLLSC